MDSLLVRASNNDNNPRMKKRESKKNKNKKSKVSAGPTKSIPAAYSTQLTNRKADIVTSSKGVKIRHTEYIRALTVAQDVSTTFQWTITPTNAALFPWLFKIASSYEKYTFHQLVFKYYPIIATSNSGGLSMAVDLDPGDPAPDDVSDIMAMEDAVRGVVYFPLALNVNCAKLNGFLKERFTGSYASGSGGTLKNYAAGRLYMITDSRIAAGEVTIGDVMVSYEVELITPQQPEFDSSIDCYRDVDIDNPFGTTNKQIIGKDVGFRGYKYEGNIERSKLTEADKFEGLVQFVCSGTELTDVSFANSTATVDVLHQVPAADGTSIVSLIRVIAIANQYLQVLVTGTTLVGSAMIYMYRRYKNTNLLGDIGDGLNWLSDEPV